MFEDLAYGKAPYGSYFSRGFLCCSFKGKEFSYKVNQYKSTNSLFQEVQTIFQNRLGLRSREDLEHQRERFNETSREKALEECDDWTLIKRKEVRNLLLSKYILKLSYEKSLTKQKTRQAYACLILALQLKILTVDDIDIKKGIIKEINGIEQVFDPDLKSWTLAS